MKKIFLLLLLSIFIFSCGEDPKDPKDLCKDITCSGHGTCKEVNKKATCECEVDYKANGLACEKVEDLCKDVTCSDHGRCEVKDNNATCKCDTNFQSNGLECIAVETACKGIECSNHGECEVKNNEAICKCDEGYEVDGLKCNEVINLCKDITCSNHGECEVKNNEATCKCESTYHADGVNCIKDGETNLCENIDCGGGNCQVIENVAKCICNDGFNDDDNDLFCSSNYMTITEGTANFEIGGGIVIDSHDNRWVIGEFSGTLDLGCEDTLMSTGESNGFIAKFDSSNRCRKLLALQGNEYVVPTDIETDGENIYITGSFMGNIDLDPSTSNSDFISNGEVDFFVLKLDNNGNYITAKTFGGIEDDYISAIKVFENKIYLVGSFKESVIFNTEAVISNGEDDLFILQLDDSLGYLNLYHNGGVYSDTINDIVITSDSIYVVGEFSGTINFASTGIDKKTAVSRDGFILKLNSDFTSVWCRQIGGDLDDFLSKIILDSENNLKVAGSFSDIVDFNWDNPDSELLISDGHYDMFITSITSDGGYLNTLLFEGLGGDEGLSGNDWINDMIIYNDDNVCIVGDFSDLIDFDPYHTTGIDATKVSQGKSDIFVTCLSSDSYNFTYTFGEDLQDAAYGIALDSHKNLVVTGKFQGTANFSPLESSPDEHTSNGKTDIFIWNYQIQ